MLVRTLNIDSANWITKDTVEEKIRDMFIVPHALNTTEYYIHLIVLSLLSVSGK